jgi:diguanylate cyclase (GGDEF)-like protein/PAS domain S-box-containing protein
LVVDDEQINRTLLRRMLARYDIETVEADSGEAALELIAEGDFSLVLLDISMPNMDGFEVLMQIRSEQDEAALPVIMVTASDEREQVIRAFDLGANDYVNKPIDPGVTAARVRTQLRLRAAQSALRESEQRYALAAQGANDGLWDWNLITDEVYYSPRWKAMVGLAENHPIDSPQEFLGRIHRDDFERVEAELDLHLTGETPHFEMELRIQRCDNSYRWMLCRGLAVRDQEQRAIRIAGSLTDVTEGKVADALTGLPNRLLFKERVDRSFEQFRRSPVAHFSVLYLDIDNFKLVNDGFGHDAGDQLLIAVARRIESCLRNSDSIVSRIGGDEFAVLVKHVEGEDVSELVAERIIGSLDEPIKLSNDREVFVTLSIGYSSVSDRCVGAQDLLREADTAMYQAKAQGKSCACCYDPRMHQKVKARLDLENELHRAITSDEFVLHYQPIVNLETGQALGAEALVRWCHAERGMVPPNDFISTAEETGLIVPLGRWVMDEACRQLAEWKKTARLPEEFWVAVNLSPRQFHRGQLVETVDEVLKKHQLDTVGLRLEVTESGIMVDADKTTKILAAIRDRGVQISLDDFGTGYSSLAYLHRLPLDTIKIDRSFVLNMEHKSNIAIIKAITGLSAGLDLQLVAEGVETAAQRQKLLEAGCTIGQGYLFSRPVEASEFISAMENNAGVWPAPA